MKWNDVANYLAYNVFQCLILAKHNYIFNIHKEMMGLIGMGNNPMVGATVAVAVAIEEAMNK